MKKILLVAAITTLSLGANASLYPYAESFSGHFLNADGSNPATSYKDDNRALTVRHSMSYRYNHSERTHVWLRHDHISINHIVKGNCKNGDHSYTIIDGFKFDADSYRCVDIEGHGIKRIEQEFTKQSGKESFITGMLITNQNPIIQWGSYKGTHYTKGILNVLDGKFDGQRVIDIQDLLKCQSGEYGPFTK